MFTEIAHVYVIIAVWIFTKSRRTTAFVAALIGVGLFVLVSWVLGGDPGLSFLGKWGMFGYLRAWATVVLPALVAPLLATTMLLKADAIAPRIIKDWRPVYGEA